jgi:hypothetical protein
MMSREPFILPTFRRICERIPYRQKSIFFSELFLFLRACDQRRVEVIIESGVKHGGSTSVLAAAFWGRLLSIDRAFLPSFVRTCPPGVQLIEGDATREIPRLLGNLEGLRVGVLIDGPKGAAAQALKDVCLQHACVEVVGVHDVARGQGERRHSHEATFREYFGRELDGLLPAASVKKYPSGPGLALWSREEMRP